jgi:DNA-binding XRE family transcriptional regulator
VVVNNKKKLDMPSPANYKWVDVKTRSRSVLLKDWMEERGTPNAWLARQIGVTRQAVAPYVNGEGKPSLENAEKISKATDGAVTVKELLYPEGLPKGASWE